MARWSYEAKGNVAPGNAYGTLTFGSGLTQQASDHASTTNGGTDTFLGLASFLLGVPTSGSIDNNASYYISRPYYSGYAQDDWHVNNHLTLNFGVRYEVQLAYKERYNRMADRFTTELLVNPCSVDADPRAVERRRRGLQRHEPEVPFSGASTGSLWRLGLCRARMVYPHARTTRTGRPPPRARLRLSRVGSKDWSSAAAWASSTSRTRPINNSQTGFSVSTSYLSTFTNGQFPVGLYPITLVSRQSVHQRCTH